jgi:hypothetical protein
MWTNSQVPPNDGGVSLGQGGVAARVRSLAQHSANWLRSSTPSQTALRTTIIGMASSIPGTPHNQLQNRMPAKSAIRLICARRPSSAGVSQ